MVYRSQNGWVAAKAASDLPGGAVRISPIGNNRASFLVARRAAPAFQYLIDHLDARVEDVDLYAAGDDWSYLFRDVRDADDLSNHASGCAIDYNATRHPLGVPASRTFTARQIREIHEICRDELQGIVRWGGDYRGRQDGMHFEIVASPARVAEVMAHLNNTPMEEDDMATPNEILYAREIENPENPKERVSLAHMAKRSLRLGLDTNADVDKLREEISELRTLVRGLAK